MFSHIFNDLKLVSSKTQQRQDVPGQVNQQTASSHEFSSIFIKCPLVLRFSYNTLNLVISAVIEGPPTDVHSKSDETVCGK